MQVGSVLGNLYSWNANLVLLSQEGQRMRRGGTNRNKQQTWASVGRRDKGGRVTSKPAREGDASVGLI